MPKKKPLNFEKNLADLEAIVEKLEKGDVNLEQSLKEFEKGIALVRNCQQALNEAELRVEKLVTEQDQEELVAFETEEDA